MPGWFLSLLIGLPELSGEGQANSLRIRYGFPLRPLPPRFRQRGGRVNGRPLSLS